MHWRRKWQPTPVFLPGESQGGGSLVGCRLWGRTESDTTEATEERETENIINIIYDKTTANLILNGQTSQRSESRQGGLFLPLLVNTVLEVLATAITKKKGLKTFK